MEDLREKTHTQHYELYRQKRLQEMGFSDMSADNRPVRLANTISCLDFCSFDLGKYFSHMYKKANG